jgi:sRNA-binding protein
MTFKTKALLDIVGILAGEFPQAFTFAQHEPHRPLKLNVDHDLAMRFSAMSRAERNTVLRFYTSRVAYLSSCTAGAYQYDLDGNIAGHVNTSEAEHAANRLAGIMAAREAKRQTRRARGAQEEGRSTGSNTTSACTVIAEATLADFADFQARGGVMKRRKHKVEPCRDRACVVATALLRIHAERELDLDPRELKLRLEMYPREEFADLTQQIAAEWSSRWMSGRPRASCRTCVTSMTTPSRSISKRSTGACRPSAVHHGHGATGISAGSASPGARAA